MTTTKQLLGEVEALLVKTIKRLNDAQQPSIKQFKPWTVAEAEAYWREQIALEIEDLICTTPHLTSDISVECQIERYSYYRAAEISRGSQ